MKLSLLIFNILIINIIHSENIDFNNKFSGKTISLIGSFRLPKQIQPKTYFYICYNGEILKLRENESSFIIKDKENEQINILFVAAENLSFCSQENTILCLKLSTKKNYKFYKLFKIQKNKIEPNLQKWKIEEDKLIANQNKIEIPLNTLIIPLDPNKIQIQLHNMSWKKDGNLIKLPMIEIISTNEEINDEFLKSSLTFINFKTFHAKQEKRKREIHHDNTKICLLIDE